MIIFDGLKRITKLLYYWKCSGTEFTKKRSESSQFL